MRVAEPAISHDEVIEIIDALTDIKAWTREILRILKTRRKMSRRRDWHPPWMTPEEWAEWKAGENDRSRRLYERARKGHEELEARKRAADEAEQRRARRRRFFLFR
jgi:hypothetical protein